MKPDVERSIRAAYDLEFPELTFAIWLLIKFWFRCSWCYIRGHKYAHEITTGYFGYVPCDRCNYKKVLY